MWNGAHRFVEVPFKRAWRNPVPYMEKDEIDGLLRAPDRATGHGQRDYALLLFLYNSGARATEAAQVLIEDLTWDATGTGSVKIQWKRPEGSVLPALEKDDELNSNRSSKDEIPPVHCSSTDMATP